MARVLRHGCPLPRSQSAAAGPKSRRSQRLSAAGSGQIGAEMAHGDGKSRPLCPLLQAAARWKQALEPQQQALESRQQAMEPQQQALHRQQGPLELPKTVHLQRSGGRDRREACHDVKKRSTASVPAAVGAGNEGGKKCFSLPRQLCFRIFALRR